jgi:hypothetical protein
LQYILLLSVLQVFFRRTLLIRPSALRGSVSARSACFFILVCDRSALCFSSLLFSPYDYAEKE